MKKAMYLALEGGVCSGKSTLSYLLSRQKHIGRVPEYFELITEQQQDELLALDQQSQLQFLLQLERERCSTHFMGIRPRVADRSILTMIATQYALYHTGNDHALNELFIIQQDAHLIPNIIVFLDIPHEERIARWCVRDPHAKRHFFTDESFNHWFKIFFEVLSGVVPVYFTTTYQTDSGRICQKIAEQRPHSTTLTFNEIVQRTCIDIYP